MAFESGLAKWVAGQGLGGLPAGMRHRCLVDGETMRRRLSKSIEDYSLQGVWGGIAEYFGWSSFRVRLIFAVFVVFSGFVPGIIVYVVLSFLMPMAGEDEN